MKKDINHTSVSYHQKRYSEFVGDDTLFKAWSYFGWNNYIKPFALASVLELGGALGWNLLCCAQHGIKCEMVELSEIGRND